MDLKILATAYRTRKAGGMESAVIAAVDSLRPQWEETMVAILAAIIEDFGNGIAEDLDAEPPKGAKPDGHKWVFDPTSAAIRAWIKKHGAKDVTSILATDINDLKRVILAGTDENLSTPQIARNIRRFYTDRSPYKAMRVARTETAKASSFGSLEAARQSGVAEKKVWLTSRDDRVRDEHVVMDGESAGLNGTFSNGLEFPSEPNCRCVLTFKSGDRGG